MSRVLVGFEECQAQDRESGTLVTGSLELDEDGTVRFRPTPQPGPEQGSLSPAEAVRGSFGAYEEVETPQASD